jgi:hypothetical protein
MRLGWSTLGRATILISMVFTVGCGGINTTGSVNPLMFLVPGLGQTGPGPVEQPDRPEASEPIHIADTR